MTEHQVSAHAARLLGYTCDCCDKRTLHEFKISETTKVTTHFIEGKNRASKRVDAAAEESSNKLERADRALYKSINKNHDFDAVRLKVKCPHCGSIQKWSVVPPTWAKSGLIVFWIIIMAACLLLPQMLAPQIPLQTSMMVALVVFLLVAFIPPIAWSLRHKKAIDDAKRQEDCFPIYFNGDNISSVMSFLQETDDVPISVQSDTGVRSSPAEDIERYSLDDDLLPVAKAATDADSVSMRCDEEIGSAKRRQADLDETLARDDRKQNPRILRLAIAFFLFVAFILWMHSLPTSEERAAAKREAHEQYAEPFEGVWELDSLVSDGDVISGLVLEYAKAVGGNTFIVLSEDGTFTYEELGDGDNNIVEGSWYAESDGKATMEAEGYYSSTLTLKDGKIEIEENGASYYYVKTTEEAKHTYETYANALEDGAGEKPNDVIDKSGNRRALNMLVADDERVRITLKGMYYDSENDLVVAYTVENKMGGAFELVGDSGNAFLNGEACTLYCDDSAEAGG